MSPTEPKVLTPAEVFARMGLPVQPGDHRDTVTPKRLPPQFQAQPTPPRMDVVPTGLTAAGRSNYAARRKVVFQVPGGFTFSLPFLGAALSSCRRYLILSLEESESDTFKLAGNSENPVRTEVHIPDIPVRVVTENSDKSFEYVIDGLKYFVFPVVEDLTVVEAADRGVVLADMGDDEGETDDDVPAEGDDIAADVTAETDYTGPVYDILFGTK